MKRHNKSTLIGLMVILALVGVTSFLFSISSGQKKPPLKDWDKIDFSFEETKIANIADPSEKATEMARLDGMSVFKTQEYWGDKTAMAYSGEIFWTEPAPEDMAGEVIYGIQEDFQFYLLWREAKATNGWVGIVNGQNWSVAAGAWVRDPEQGLVQINFPNGKETAMVLLEPPEKVGALRIEEVVGTRVRLSAENSDKLYYVDLLARCFVPDMFTIFSTATPLPTSTPILATPLPSPTWNPYPIHNQQPNSEQPTPYP